MWCLSMQELDIGRYLYCLLLACSFKDGPTGLKGIPLLDLLSIPAECGETPSRFRQVDLPSLTRVRTQLRELQTLVLSIMKGYWLQRYIIHCCLQKVKRSPEKKPQRTSQFAAPKAAKTIDQLVDILERQVPPPNRDNNDEAAGCKLSWRSVFPAYKVDDR